MFFISVSILLSNYIQTKKNQVFDDKNFQYYALTTELKNLEEEKYVEPLEGEETDEQTSDEYFIGFLEIPKIGLKKGLVDPTSSDNNIEQNVTIINGSDLPDVKAGNLILAAHSGNAAIAFFRELDLLTEGDNAYVTFNGRKYTYKITKIYYQEKTGKIGIYRDYSKTTLTLVTCTRSNDSTQTIYIAELQ